MMQHSTFFLKQLRSKWIEPYMGKLVNLSRVVIVVNPTFENAFMVHGLRLKNILLKELV